MRSLSTAVGTSAGSLSPRTNWTSLADFEFALPVIEEQRRIILLTGSQRVKTLKQFVRPLTRLKRYFDQPSYRFSSMDARRQEIWKFVKLSFNRDGV